MEIKFDSNFKSSERLQTVKYGSIVRLWMVMILLMPLFQVFALLLVAFSWLFSLLFFGISGITAEYPYGLAWEVIKIPYHFITAEKIKND